MVNLLSLNLDKDIYFHILSLLQSYNKKDINEFEMFLIKDLIEMKLVFSLEDMKTRINLLEDKVDNIQYDTDTAYRNSIQCKERIDRIDDNISKKQDKLVNKILEILHPLDDIINYIVNKKTVNMRRPIYPSKTILNLRQKLQEIAE